jgi:hypothetical protein
MFRRQITSERILADARLPFKTSRSCSIAHRFIDSPDSFGVWYGFLSAIHKSKKAETILRLSDREAVSTSSAAAPA